MELHLEEIKLSESPTSTQLSDLCRNISKFLNRVAATMILEGKHMANEPQCGGLLNSATQLKQVADIVDNAPNSAGLALPQAGPMAVPRR